MRWSVIDEVRNEDNNQDEREYDKVIFDIKMTFKVQFMMTNDMERNEDDSGCYREDED